MGRSLWQHRHTKASAVTGSSDAGSSYPNINHSLNASHPRKGTPPWVRGHLLHLYMKGLTAKAALVAVKGTIPEL